MLPTKRILSEHEAKTFFQHSEALARFMTFLSALNASVRNLKRSEVTKPLLDDVKDPVAILLLILQDIQQLADEHPPFAEDESQRFGNKAFRDFIGSLEVKAEQILRSRLPAAFHPALQEFRSYLVASFGNGTRIDYGSGHELNFMLFLCCLWLVGFLDPERFATRHYLSQTTTTHVVATSPAPTHSSAQEFKAPLPPNELEACRQLQQIALVVFHTYLQLVRRLQREYRLEPAGSHGVWGLDDFQFLVYLLGSAQFLDHRHLKPKSMLNRDILNTYHHDYLFLEAIQFIHEMKRGPFHEHSPMLFDISGVPSWHKVNSGLIKMFVAEVLEKFPIVQHIEFGVLLPYEPVHAEASLPHDTQASSEKA